MVGNERCYTDNCGKVVAAARQERSFCKRYGKAGIFTKRCSCWRERTKVQFNIFYRLWFSKAVEGRPHQVSDLLHQVMRRSRKRQFFIFLSFRRLLPQLSLSGRMWVVQKAMVLWPYNFTHLESLPSNATYRNKAWYLCEENVISRRCSLSSCSEELLYRYSHTRLPGSTQ